MGERSVGISQSAEAWKGRETKREGKGERLRERERKLAGKCVHVRSWERRRSGKRERRGADREKLVGKPSDCLCKREAGYAKERE